MRLLLDTCVWGGAAEALRSAGFDVVWAGDWPEDPGDEEILRRAYAGRRTLVTLEEDFGELAIVFGARHSGILRLVGVSAREQGALCERVLKSHGKEIERGAVVTVEPGRLRVRPPTAQR